MVTGTYSNAGSIVLSTAGFGIRIETGDRPEKTPRGLLNTRAVELREGWFGQIIVDEEIVFQSAVPHGRSVDAIEEVNGRVVDRIKALFGDPATVEVEASSGK